MSEIVIYGVVGSPFVRSVEMGLKEKRAPYRLHAMNPGETKSEAAFLNSGWVRICGGMYRPALCGLAASRFIASRNADA